MKRILLFSLSIVFSYSLFSQVITKGSDWKYLDDGSDQGTSWQAIDYDDSGWSTGFAQLGYGDGDETTILSYGDDPGNRYITYYFRKTITIDNPEEMDGLKIEPLRDDGAVVYINGQEVVRSNMPSGNITYTTLASHTVAGSEEKQFFEFYYPSSVLVPGENVIAVEVHQMSSSSSDLSFDFKMDFSELISFRKAPYLIYPGSNTKMTILWQTYSTEICEFKWGTDTTYSNGIINSEEYGDDHQHKIELSGLSPGVRYFYMVIGNYNTLKSNFIAGAEDNKEKFTFYAYGDTRSQPDKHNLVAEQILASINVDPESQTFIVNSGDLVEDGENEFDWDKQFFPAEYEYIGLLLSHLPYLAALGNHEDSGDLFEKYFPYPMFASSRFYYSFDYGNAHFVVIDEFTSFSEGSDQYKWLVNDFQNSNKRWKIVLLHKPGWSAGGGHPNNTNVQLYLQPLFEQYGISFVIAGHNHYYSRAEINKIEHITTGGGGAPLYTPNPNADSIVKVDASYHFCKLAINYDTLTFTATRSDGSLIETFKYINQHLGTIEKSADVWNILVYGNNNAVIVNNTDNVNGTIEIFNLAGSSINKGKLKRGMNMVRISSEGIFLVKVVAADGKYLVKKVFISQQM